MLCRLSLSSSSSLTGLTGTRLHHPRTSSGSNRRQAIGFPWFVAHGLLKFLSRTGTRPSLLNQHFREQCFTDNSPEVAGSLHPREQILAPNPLSPVSPMDRHDCWVPNYSANGRSIQHPSCDLRSDRWLPPLQPLELGGHVRYRGVA